MPRCWSKEVVGRVCCEPASAVVQQGDGSSGKPRVRPGISRPPAKESEIAVAVVVRHAERADAPGVAGHGDRHRSPPPSAPIDPAPRSPSAAAPAPGGGRALRSSTDRPTAPCLPGVRDRDDRGKISLGDGVERRGRQATLVVEIDGRKLSGPSAPIPQISSPSRRHRTS